MSRVDVLMSECDVKGGMNVEMEDCKTTTTAGDYRSASSFPSLLQSTSRLSRIYCPHALRCLNTLRIYSRCTLCMANNFKHSNTYFHPW